MLSHFVMRQEARDIVIELRFILSQLSLFLMSIGEDFKALPRSNLDCLSSDTEGASSPEGASSSCRERMEKKLEFLRACIASFQKINQNLKNLVASGSVDINTPDQKDGNYH